MSQQPVGHEAELQTQWPPTHCWPATQAAPVVPHWHTPVAEQLSATLALQVTHAAPPEPQLDVERAMQLVPLQQLLGHEVALHTHAPPTHCWPLAHGGPEPQAHAPAVQVSALMPQPTQVAPLVPHAPVVVPLRQALL